VVDITGISACSSSCRCVDRCCLFHFRNETSKTGKRERFLLFVKERLLSLTLSVFSRISETIWKFFTAIREEKGGMW